MMVAPTVFHGTDAEKLLLVAAIANNCVCDPDAAGLVTTLCPAHRMLIESQSILDHLLFARRLRAQWLKAEGMA